MVGESTKGTLEEALYLTSFQVQTFEPKCLPEACNAESCRRVGRYLLLFVIVHIVNVAVEVYVKRRLYNFCIIKVTFPENKDSFVS